jgi:hypothetical protein
MNKIENIEKEVRSLTAAELVAFQKWFAEFDADARDCQLERDSTSGSLRKTKTASVDRALKAGSSGRLDL